jgi:glycosyltransferase involved in cell wall biosynthesis
MFEDAKIAVIIPCFMVSEHIEEVVSSVPGFVDHVIVVDDCCPENSGSLAQRTGREGLIVLRNQMNLGVGGAVTAGYAKAEELGCDIMIKMDGDGQMDPEQMEKLIIPLVRDEADYAKGNRFNDFRALREMPRMRLIGNGFLSFMLKVASGYWDIMDPTNGYTAIHKRALYKLSLGKISKRFFFESDMLINMGIARVVVMDVSMPARYGEEKSTLNIWKTLFHFPPRLFVGFVKRIFLRYFVYDFNMASIYILLGIPLLIFGLLYGLDKWIESLRTMIPAPLGSIMVATLPIIVSMEMLLQAINIDINSVPRKRQ